MSLSGLGRMAATAADWMAAWNSVDICFRKKLESVGLDEAMIWAGLRGNRDVLTNLLFSRVFFSADPVRATIKLDWCTSLQHAGRPAGDVGLR